MHISYCSNKAVKQIEKQKCKMQGILKLEWSNAAITDDVSLFL